MGMTLLQHVIRKNHHQNPKPTSQEIGKVGLRPFESSVDTLYKCQVSGGIGRKGMDSHAMVLGKSTSDLNRWNQILLRIIVLILSIYL